ncbi:venom serine protease [Halyomorpha halys]|uniref:venom serine protease n=1 Tax=Halyomorpha halys TaxID=286706 RepID=UPI0006D4FA70|nr:venom serine protease-like [Halyomorpha halys]
MNTVLPLAILFSAASALVPTSCPCGLTNRGRIVGGREAKKNEFPLAAALVFTGDEEPEAFCGATILTPFHAITAAHCTQDQVKEYIDYIKLLVGAHNVKNVGKEVQFIPVEKFLDHEDYTPKDPNGRPQLNDVSLVVLKEEIRFNVNVGPACLPTGQLELERQYVKVMGWGLTQTGGEGSNVLREVNLMVVPYKTCESFFNLNPQRGQFCSFGKNKDTCKGDSGGPLVWVDPETNRLTLVGLVSYGSKTCGTNPAVNTDVSRYLDWIQTKISGSGKPGTTCQKMNATLPS